jgi:hypothetical protein
VKVNWAAPAADYEKHENNEAENKALKNLLNGIQSRSYFRRFKSFTKRGIARKIRRRACNKARVRKRNMRPC